MPTATDAKDLKYGPIVAVVNSNSEPNKKYEVRRQTDGTYSCQCFGWRFNKDVPRMCRHTRAASTAAPMSKAAIAASRTAAPMTIREEATRAAKEIIQHGTVLLATDRIEALIKKFMSKTIGELAAATVATSEMDYAMDSGVRMITLDD